MALGSLSSWAFNFFVGITFPSLEDLLPKGLVFLPFGLTTGLLALLVYYYLPETRNKDPSEIAPKVANGFKSKLR